MATEEQKKVTRRVHDLVNDLNRMLDAAGYANVYIELVLFKPTGHRNEQVSVRSAQVRESVIMTDMTKPDVATA